MSTTDTPFSPAQLAAKLNRLCNLLPNSTFDACVGEYIHSDSDYTDLQERLTCNVKKGERGSNPWKKEYDATDYHIFVSNGVIAEGDVPHTFRPFYRRDENARTLRVGRNYPDEQLYHSPDTITLNLVNYDCPLLGRSIQYIMKQNGLHNTKHTLHRIMRIMHPLSTIVINQKITTESCKRRRTRSGFRTVKTIITNELDSVTYTPDNAPRMEELP